MPAIWPVMRLLIMGMMANVAPSAPCTNTEAVTVMTTAIDQPPDPAEGGHDVAEPVGVDPRWSTWR